MLKHYKNYIQNFNEGIITTPLKYAASTVKNAAKGVAVGVPVGAAVGAGLAAGGGVPLGVGALVGVSQGAGIGANAGGIVGIHKQYLKNRQNKLNMLKQRQRMINGS